MNKTRNPGNKVKTYTWDQFKAVYFEAAEALQHSFTDMTSEEIDAELSDPRNVFVLLEDDTLMMVDTRDGAEPFFYDPDEMAWHAWHPADA